MSRLTTLELDSWGWVEDEAGDGAIRGRLKLSWEQQGPEISRSVERDN